MQIDRRITNGLAWAGLFVVVAVPVADAVSNQLMGEPKIAVATVAELPRQVAPMPAPLSQRPHAALIETAAIAPVQPAVVKPAAPAANKSAVVKPAAPAANKPAAAAANPVVDDFLSSGQALPSYITGGGAEPAQAVVAPAPAKPAAPAVIKPVVAPAQTAVIAPAPPMVAPVAPVATDPIEVATLTPANVPPMPMPLSMRPKPVTRPLASQQPQEEIVLPPEVVANNNANPAVVDDLRDWESGPLSEFLARRQSQQSSSATVTSQRAFPDGYSDEGNGRPRPPRDVYLGPVEDDAVFFPFVN